MYVMNVAFWNVENLFDHERASRDPDLERKIGDELRRWTADVRDKKIRQLKRVVRSLGPHLLGVSEVENEHVLKRLAKASGSQYGVVGHPSPDKRGIDVCFLYDKNWLDVVEGGFSAIALGYPTRDLVWARFEIVDTDLTFIAIVTHWPSRSNPTSTRRTVGRAVHELIRFLRKAYGPGTPFLVMGDFNDGPRNRSVYEDLRARSRQHAWADSSGNTLFNATAYADTASIPGTHYYNSEWNTLDHIAVSRELLRSNAALRLQDGSAEIHAPSWVRKQGGKPRRFGRPNKGLDEGGFSDHFAVSVRLEID